MEGALGILSSVPVPLILCPLVHQLCRKSRSPCPVAALPVCPVCLELAPGMARAPSPRTPTFRQPLGPPAGGLPPEDPLELRWEGGTLSSQHCPHHPRGRNSSVAGFPLHTSEHLSHGQLLAQRVLLPDWDHRVPPRPAVPVAAWEVHTSTRCSTGLMSWQRLRVLTFRALLPIHACLSVGLEGDPGIRVPLGLRHQFTAHPQGYPVPSRPLGGGGLGEVCVLGGTGCHGDPSLSLTC